MQANMENRSLVTIAEHSKEKILYLLEMAKEFENKPNRKILDGKVVATLFFEPSTFSFLRSFGISKRLRNYFGHIFKLKTLSF